MGSFFNEHRSFKKNGIKGGKTMKKKMLSAFLCAAMAVTLVAGCGAPAADAGKDKGGDSKKRRRKEFRKMKSR